jgi:hypothetical protein
MASLSVNHCSAIPVVSHRNIPHGQSTKSSQLALLRSWSGELSPGVGPGPRSFPLI